MNATHFMSTAIGILEISVARKYEFARARLAYAEALKAVLKGKEFNIDELSLDIDQLEDLCGVSVKMTNCSAAWPYVHSVQEMRNGIEAGDAVNALCRLVQMVTHEHHDIAYCNALIGEMILTYADNLTCSSWRELLLKHMH